MFHAAHSLGMTLSEYMARTTVREHQAYTQWLIDEWDSPSRSDHYLMQIAHILIQANSKRGAKVSFDKCKIHFKVKGRPDVLQDRMNLTPEEVAKRETIRRQHAANMAKSVWLGRLGVKNVRVVRPT